MSTQWQYSIEQFGGPDHTYKNTAGKGGLQMLLNDKAMEGWELVQQQPAFDGNGRLPKCRHFESHKVGAEGLEPPTGQ
jgi:hypothetical protein